VNERDSSTRRKSARRTRNYLKASANKNQFRKQAVTRPTRAYLTNWKPTSTATAPPTASHRCRQLPKMATANRPRQAARKPA
jgi:hypothetical protein